MKKQIKTKTAKRWLNRNKWEIAKAKLFGWKGMLKKVLMCQKIAKGQ